MKYKVTLKGKTYEVEVDQGEAMILDEYEAYAPAPAAAPAAAAAPATAPAAAPAAPAAPVAVAGEQVVSPMPGTMVKINVSAGKAVLEAMKMENEIMAPHDATVVQVLVDVGSKVDTGTPIIVLG